MISVRRARNKEKATYEESIRQTVKEFDRRFDAGVDVFDLVEPDKIRAIQADLEIKRTTLYLPAHLLEKLDREAALRGITRQSLIRVWLHLWLTR